MVIIAPLVMNSLHGPAAADQADMPKLTLGLILTSRRPNPRRRYLSTQDSTPDPFALQSRQAKGTQEGQA